MSYIFIFLVINFVYILYTCCDNNSKPAYKISKKGKVSDLNGTTLTSKYLPTQKCSISLSSSDSSRGNRRSCEKKSKISNHKKSRNSDENKLTHRSLSIRSNQNLRESAYLPHTILQDPINNNVNKKKRQKQFLKNEKKSNSNEEVKKSSIDTFQKLVNVPQDGFSSPVPSLNKNVLAN
ncbi:Hypothetical protein SRAE_1000313000 [Strongyloides ratti]|uniref:Uncharacterized protein n=1 Tax=Strongyloides ratti TaxID=34506 RepID=A0A090L575_STRRB|nr:Hypothetical protein SRAE_1000313000 [Strongyloides ratti]CEF64877.1 Hypothetical protein SRAE_1000313000 [Strongyloides ratti]